MAGFEAGTSSGKREQIAPTRPRVAGPQRLDELIVVTRGRAWITLVALAVLLAGLVVWAVVARVPVTSNVGAVLISGGVLAEVASPGAGVVESLAVGVGDTVDTGDDIAVIQAPDGSRSGVQATQDGTVAAVVTRAGDTVEAATVLVKVVPDGPPRLHGFPTFDVGQQLEVGDAAMVTISTPGAGSEVFDATISQIIRAPLTREDVTGVVGDAALAQFLVPQGQTVMAIELHPRRNADLPEAPAASPALVGTASVVLAEQHPISMFAR